MKKIHIGYFVTLVLIICMGGFSFFYVNKQNENSTIEITQKSKIYNVTSDACFKHIYYNIEDLTDNSYNIIIGKIKNIEYIDERAIARTVCDIEVEEVLAGEDIKDETEIKILEYQGYCRLSKFIEVYGNEHFVNYDTSNADKEYFKYTADGEPMVVEGERYVYFLSPCLSSNEINGEYYEIIGTFMGKYLIEDNICERYTPSPNFYNIQEKNRISINNEGIKLDDIREYVLSAKGR